jgi:hypothetical protein
MACGRSHDSGDACAHPTKTFAARRSGPRKLADNQKRPTWIANDDKNVYWTTEHEIVGVDKRGDSLHTLATGIADPGRLVSDGIDVYWLDRGVGLDDGSLARVPIAGGTVHVLASGFRAGEALAVDGDYVYWGADDRIIRRAKSGGPDGILATHVDATAIDVDQTNVYWSNADHDDYPRIGAADFEGSQQVLLGGPAPGFALSVRATPGEICWTSRATADQGGVWCLRRGGAIPRHLAAGEAWTLAVRGRAVYWIRSGPDARAELVCTPLDAGTSTVLASGCVSDVTADRDGVYWTDIQGSVYVAE